MNAHELTSLIEALADFDYADLEGGLPTLFDDVLLFDDILAALKELQERRKAARDPNGIGAL